jgi:hypothetical protein
MVMNVDFMVSYILKLEFFILLEFMIDLMAPLHIIKEKDQFVVIVLCFKQILDNYMLNISTCILIAPSPKISRLLLRNIFGKINYLTL